MIESTLFPIVSKINEYLSNYILIFLLVFHHQHLRATCQNRCGQIISQVELLCHLLEIFHILSCHILMITKRLIAAT